MHDHPLSGVWTLSSPLSLLWLGIHINIATPQEPFWFQILHCNDCITWTLSSSYNFLIVSAVSPCQPCLLFIFSDRCNLLRRKYSYLHFNVVFLFIYVKAKEKIILHACNPRPGNQSGKKKENKKYGPNFLDEEKCILVFLDLPSPLHLITR